MKKFKAFATTSYDLVHEFELEDDEMGKDFNPFTYARDNLDGSDYKEVDGSGDWDVYDVVEVNS